MRCNVSHSRKKKVETLIHDLQTSILMVKKVARQNNDLLKYHEKDYIIILNDDMSISSLYSCSHLNIYKYRDIFFEK